MSTLRFLERLESWCSMAKFGIEMPDEFIKKLERLDKYDELAKKMLDKAAPVLVNTMKHEISRLDKYSQSGSLHDSIVAGKPKKNDFGYFVSVGPKTGSKDANGVRNGEKLAYMEYGTSKMDPHPVLDRAKMAAENRAIQIMQEVFDEEAGAK